MKYYNIYKSTDLREVGHIDQINDTIIPILRDERRVYLTLNRRKWPHSMPALDIFKLHKKAKLTDVLSSTFTQEFVGLVVNQRIKDILESNQLESTNVYPITVYSYNEKEKYEYYLFYILESKNIVNFAKSKYYLTDIGKNKYFKQINLDSLDEFYEAYSKTESDRRVAAKIVALNRNPDLFRLPWEVYPFISENLKNQLEAAEVNGVTIEESEISFIS